MPDAIRSIITDYAGCRFRSRLEARWAAFFDLAGWRWEYEPPEQPNWIPDFLLIGDDQAIKVEVKPIAWAGAETTTLIRQATTAPDLTKVYEYVKHITPTGPNDLIYEDVLVLGAYPHHHKGQFGETMLGVFLMEQWGGPDLAILRQGHPPYKLDFHAEGGSCAYRMGGQWDGSRHIVELSSCEIDVLWRQAGNRVQWSRP
jgi:hypothetical protein